MKKNNLPVYIPLADATQRTGLSEKCLRELIDNSELQAIITPTQEVYVVEHKLGKTKTKERLIAKRFPHLQDQGITLRNTFLPKVEDIASGNSLNFRLNAERSELGRQPFSPLAFLFSLLAAGWD